MPSRRSEAPNAFASEIRQRRFQLSASRFVRCSRLSVSANFLSESAREGFCGRRICPCRTAATPTISHRSALSKARRCGDLFSSSSAGSKRARILPREPPSRRQHGSFRRTIHLGNYFPRRKVRRPEWEAESWFLESATIHLTDYRPVDEIQSLWVDSPQLAALSKLPIRSPSFPHALSGGSTGLTTGGFGTGPPIKTFGGECARDGATSAR